MNYKNIVEGKFIKRVNRFVALVRLEDHIEEVHVKNTGRCKELFIEGAKVYLEKSTNINRKTNYSLISIYKDFRLINIDSQIPNYVVHDGLKEGRIGEIGQVDFIKREVTFGQSRFDLYFESKQRKGFIEVKGVTLENNGVAMFPDAPTVRGKKHVYELIQAKEQGYEAYIFFLIQMDNITKFKPNVLTDQKFSEALVEAEKKGVKILIYNSLVTKESIQLNKPCYNIIES